MTGHKQVIYIVAKTRDVFDAYVKDRGRLFVADFVYVDGPRALKGRTMPNVIVLDDEHQDYAIIEEVIRRGRMTMGMQNHPIIPISKLG